MSRPHVTGKSLSIALLRTREAVMSSFRPHLSKLGLTEQQWRVLRVLGEATALDAGDLATHACILPASLSRIIGALREDKLILTKPLASDGRRTIVSLAAKGRKILNDALPETARIYRQLEKRIGSDELLELQRLLEHVQSRLSES